MHRNEYDNTNIQEFMRKVNGQPLLNIWRNMDTLIIMLGRPSDPIEIHINCYFRLFESTELIFTKNEVYRSAINYDEEEYIWVLSNKSLFDKTLYEIYDRFVFCRVKEVCYFTDSCDFHIYFEKKFCLEILQDTTEPRVQYTIYASERKLQRYSTGDELISAVEEHEIPVYEYS